MTPMSRLVCRVPSTSGRPEGAHVICYAEAWGQGGIETFLMELFRRCQGKGIAFTLFSTWEWNDNFDTELKALGIDRYTVFPDSKPGQVKRLREGSAAFAELIDVVQADAVYVNTMNGMGFLYSEVARRRGVSSRVVHSHNSAFGSGSVFAKAIMHTFGRTILSRSATLCLACSADAGRYLFGDRQFAVVNNGIDTARFTFDPMSRAMVRMRFGIPQDVPLFGSVGRMAEAKNPLFQIRTFAEVLRFEPNAYYLMVGDGEMKCQVETLIGDLGIADRVVMPGYFADPAPVYSALDCFLMPSLFEGLAIVLIEAQCAGCRIVCSEALPPEAHVSDVEVMLPLSAGERVWAEKAVEMSYLEVDRTAYATTVREAGFDADDTARKVAGVLKGGKNA